MSNEITEPQALEDFEGDFSEDYEDGEERPFHNIRGYTQPDGSIHAVHTTNDNEDLGYPSEQVTWIQTYRDREQFEKICGKSRYGTLCDVLVILDEVKL